MLLCFIFCLLVLSLFLLLLKFKKAGLSVMIMALMLFLLIGNGVLISPLMQDLESAYTTPSPLSWKSKNAIILLGAGAVKVPKIEQVKPSVLGYGRLQESARLYFSCKKTNSDCKIITSGGDGTHAGESEAVVYKTALISIGVQPSDIIIESNSLNTFKNAELSSKILESSPFNQVFLVTSAFHLNRSLLYFNHFGVFPIPRASDYFSNKISFLPTGYNFTLADLAIMEKIGIIRYHFYNFVGWNPPKQAPSRQSLFMVKTYSPRGIIDKSSG
jgi:uncharacterized SAM-binding protein YcdF (DUF218 family)